MEPTPGTRLGPYEIVAPLGAGGMGEVHRARDTKLGREVALKFLPQQFARDAERLARFEREAKTLAALNHPHIAHIHGLEESGEHRALVMELVEGATVAERIARGAVPTDEALPIAKQLAEALEYAHEQGVVHRDLKPANIKITPDGAVKVLDFGLAKALEGGPPGRTPANSPTLTSPAITRAGMILGTAAYMSPEQARGTSVDKRTDIWAFGVVLYEMLTGRPAFPGETITDVLVAIVHKEPDWSALPATTPPIIRRLLVRCLTKDRKQRLHDIGDARLEIEEAISGAGAAAGAAPAPAPESARARASRVAHGVLTVASLLALTGVGAALWTGRWSTSPVSPAANQLTRLTITLPAGQAVTSAPAISDDGRTVAYTAALSSESPRLYIRRLDDFVSQAVPGTEGAAMPFFSPDGRSVAFFARGRLYRWNTAGGTVQTLADAPMPAGGTWSEDGTIVFVPVWNGGLYQISVSGGAPELLMRPDGKKEYAFVYPQFVPGRQEVVFTGWGSTNRIVRADLLRHNQSTVLPAGRAVTVTTSGHLLFSSGESSISGLLAEPYASSRPMQETSTVVLAGIHEALGARRLWLSVSRNGVLAYVPTDITRRTLVLVDQTGRLEPFAEQSGLYGSVALARNGRTIAADTEYRIWIYEPGQRGAVRLAPENRDAEESSPVWAPDGSRVFYASNQGGNVDIYARVVGTPRSEVILQKESNQSPDAIAPDGTLALRDTRPKTGADIWLLPPGGTATPWLATAAQEVHSDFSPDGRWLAYASDESGRSEVYVRAVRGEGRSIQLSTEGGREPAWSPQGGRLYYRQGSTMMAVDVTGRDVLTVGRPRRVFDGGWELRPAELPTMRTYAVAPDGEHFIMVRHDPEAIPNRINIVLNWLEELKVKVPVARD